MPLNYLQLQPQIDAYARDTVARRQDIALKLEIALNLLQSCGQKHLDIRPTLNSSITTNSRGDRCALLAAEPANSAFDPINTNANYVLLTSDGSQIIPNPHDALPVALINTSRLCCQPGSGQAPQVDVVTKILAGGRNSSTTDNLSDALISLYRDVEEISVLAEWQNDSGLPLIALGDGPLELFHQPQNEADFSQMFDMYLSALRSLHAKNAIAAGYTDRPRASLVAKMLEFVNEGGQIAKLDGLEDLAIFSTLIKPGQRSAVFTLWSTSSQKYMDDLALSFFYLNVGSEKFPWIARVEIPAYIAVDTQQVSLLHSALLEQCRLMGTRPYPYLLHRAHEEAVVSREEKEQLVNRLELELQRNGLVISTQSNKLSAKELQSRTRME